MMRHVTLFSVGNRSTRSGASRGQSIVELALMLPVLVLLLAGILDLGRVYFSYMAVVNAAREGARFGAAHPPLMLPCDTHAAPIVDRTRWEAQSSSINTDQILVTVTCPDADPPTSDPNGNKLGHPVRVEVRYDFYPILTRMLLGVGAIRLRSDAQMQIYAQSQ